jgi:hypothetical protein
MICIYFGFPGLYATSVCAACSQLEKLRAAILDIRQTHVTSEQDCGAETDQQEGQGQGQGQVRTSEELFGHMQTQLNDCIRHHQQIILCVYTTFIKHKLLSLFMRETRVILQNLTYFQIHGSTGRHNECCTDWSISDYAIINVFCRLLGHHGKILLTYYGVKVTNRTVCFISTPRHLQQKIFLCCSFATQKVKTKF